MHQNNRKMGTYGQQLVYVKHTFLSYLKGLLKVQLGQRIFNIFISDGDMNKITYPYVFTLQSAGFFQYSF